MPDWITMTLTGLSITAIIIGLGVLLGMVASWWLDRGR